MYRVNKKGISSILADFGNFFLLLNVKATSIIYANDGTYIRR